MNFPFIFRGSVLDAVAYFIEFFSHLNVQLKRFPQNLDQTDFVLSSSDKTTSFAYKTVIRFITMTGMPTQNYWERYRLETYLKTGNGETRSFLVGILRFRHLTRFQTKADFLIHDKDLGAQMRPIWSVFFGQLLRDNRLELSKKKTKVTELKYPKGSSFLLPVKEL